MKSIISTAGARRVKQPTRRCLMAERALRHQERDINRLNSQSTPAAFNDLLVDGCRMVGDRWEVSMISCMRPLLLAIVFGLSLGSAHAADRQVERGKYLVSILPCTDCHTPGTFLGKPDMTRYLGGSEVGFEVPGLGVFYGPNLTPDKETGLGNWTIQQIATAITTGKTPDGRILAPPMPVESFKHLTKSDALAVAAYLKTLPPIKNKVPGPFGPTEKPTSFVMQVIPADKYVPTPPPPGK